MSWFKKDSKQPKDMPAINLFKPHPGTLALALVRLTLLDWVRGKLRDTPPDLHPTPNSVHTPYGLYKYDVTSKNNAPSKLALIPFLCVSETGTITYVRIRAIYLIHILNTLAASLNQDFNTFFDTVVEGEKIVIIAGVEGVDPPRLMYSTEQEVFDIISNSQQNSSSHSAFLAIRTGSDSSLYSTMGVSNPLQTATGEYSFTYWATTTDPGVMLNLTSLEITVKSCLNDNLSELPQGGGWESNFLKPTFTHIRAKLSEHRENVDRKF